MRTVRIVKNNYLHHWVHKQSEKRYPRYSPVEKEKWKWNCTIQFEKAGEFNGQFSDVFTKSEYKQVPLMDRSAPFMHDIVVKKEGVTKLLKGLNPSKALGPDELHPSPKGTGYGIKSGIHPALPAVN